MGTFNRHPTYIWVPAIVGAKSVGRKNAQELGQGKRQKTTLTKSLRDIKVSTNMIKLPTLGYTIQ